ncbi:condensation domain-containing protein [Promicromonospora sp. NPDC057488]|uniref:condensation domain-containing protein n=1 Tax=Promicromonospora sp. NPDC057488 TaxID=3346147 RepID=UPI00366F1BFF
MVIAVPHGRTFGRRKVFMRIDGLEVLSDDDSLTWGQLDFLIAAHRNDENPHHMILRKSISLKDGRHAERVLDAIDKLICRHDALRVIVDIDAGKICGWGVFSRADWVSYVDDDSKERLFHRAASELRVDQGPPLRCLIVGSPPDRCEIWVSHYVADGAGMTTLRGEIDDVLHGRKLPPAVQLTDVRKYESSDRGLQQADRNERWATSVLASADSTWLVKPGNGTRVATRAVASGRSTFVKAKAIASKLRVPVAAVLLMSLIVVAHKETSSTEGMVKSLFRNSIRGAVCIAPSTFNAFVPFDIASARSVEDLLRLVASQSLGAYMHARYRPGQIEILESHVAQALGTPSLDGMVYMNFRPPNAAVSDPAPGVDDTRIVMDSLAKSLPYRVQLELFPSTDREMTIRVHVNGLQFYADAAEFLSAFRSCIEQLATLPPASRWQELLGK